MLSLEMFPSGTCPLVCSPYNTPSKVILCCSMQYGHREALKGGLKTSTDRSSLHVHLHLPSGPDLNQKFDVIIPPNVPCVKCPMLPDHSCVFQKTAGNIHWNASHAQPYSIAKLSVAHIISIQGQPSGNTASHTQPGNVP